MTQKTTLLDDPLNDGRSAWTDSRPIAGRRYKVCSLGRLGKSKKQAPTPHKWKSVYLTFWVMNKFAAKLWYLTIM